MPWPENRLKAIKKISKEELTPNIKNTIPERSECTLAGATSGSHSDGLRERVELLDNSFGMQRADVVIYSVSSRVGVGEGLFRFVDEPVVAVAQAAAARELLVPQVLKAREVRLDLLSAEAGAPRAEEIRVAFKRAFRVTPVPCVTETCK